MTELSGKNWDLSLYELHRTPQEAITDSKQISISPKVTDDAPVETDWFCSLYPGSAVRVDLSNMSGDADLDHDHQGVSAQVILKTFN